MSGVLEIDSARSRRSIPQTGVHQQSVALFSESEAAAWNMFQFNWRLLAGAAGVVVAGLMTTEFYIDPTGYLIISAIAALFWHSALRNIQSAKRSNTRVSYCLVAMAQILVAVSVLTTLTYLATSVALPSWDKTLLAWDLALGFDFRSYLQFINDHPRLLAILGPSYSSITWQMLAMGVILPLVGNRLRSAQAICAFALALLATTFISALVPAIGVYDTLGLKPSDFPYFEPQGYYDTLRDAPLLRSGGLHGLTLSRLVGVLTFPSFHAASAIFYTWAFWPLTLIRPLIVPWNIAMIAATPLGGGHYFVDVLAGILVAALAIRAALAISSRLSSTPVSERHCHEAQ